MKKLFNYSVMMVVMMTLCVNFSSCSSDKDEDDPNNSNTIAVIDISLDKSTLTLFIGVDYTLIVTVLPGNVTDQTVVWTSSADTVASVSNGKITAFSAGTATITAQVDNQTATCVVTVLNVPEDGVLVNGVVWAKYNVDAPGTFAANPEDVGMFYQWNRNIGWSATNPMIDSNGATAWDNDYYSTSVFWTKANDPSPAGWRVPALAEIQTLLDTDKVNRDWINDMKGVMFTDKTTGNSIFLLAAGRRSYYNGTLHSGGPFNEVGSDGFYWSSSAIEFVETNACYMFFGSVHAVWNYYGRHNEGLSVRSVAETE